MTQNVNIGDTVVINNSRFEHTYPGKYVVCELTSSGIGVKVPEKHNTGAWFRHDDYIIVQRAQGTSSVSNKNEVKVGDEVIVTNPNLTAHYGKICHVITSRNKITQCNEKDYVWVKVYDTMEVFWLRNTSYEIARKQTITHSEHCLDCKGTGQIQLLTSTVKCKCCGDNNE